MSQFDAELYERYRPDYPVEIFNCLPVQSLRQSQTILDLGAGTGRSSESFLKFNPHANLVLVEPDVHMLSAARKRLKDYSAQTTLHQCVAENPTWADPEKFDGALMGSAIHWMNVPRLIPLLARSLKSQGWLCVFEYQFPKSLDCPDLNEWIRRQFNLYWRAPLQAPRGKMKEILKPIAQSPFFERTDFYHLHPVSHFDLDYFFGVLESQSRFQRYLETLKSIEEINHHRQQILDQLRAWFLTGKLSFSYKMTVAIFSKSGKTSTL